MDLILILDTILYQEINILIRSTSMYCWDSTGQREASNSVTDV